MRRCSSGHRSHPTEKRWKPWHRQRTGYNMIQYREYFTMQKQKESKHSDNPFGDMKEGATNGNSVKFWKAEAPMVPNQTGNVSTYKGPSMDSKKQKCNASCWSWIHFWRGRFFYGATRDKWCHAWNSFNMTCEKYAKCKSKWHWFFKQNQSETLFDSLQSRSFHWKNYRAAWGRNRSGP